MTWPLHFHHLYKFQIVTIPFIPTSHCPTEDSFYIKPSMKHDSTSATKNFLDTIRSSPVPSTILDKHSLCCWCSALLIPMIQSTSMHRDHQAQDNSCFLLLTDPRLFWTPHISDLFTITVCTEASTKRRRSASSLDIIIDPLKKYTRNQIHSSRYSNTTINWTPNTNVTTGFSIQLTCQKWKAQISTRNMQPDTIKNSKTYKSPFAICRARSISSLRAMVTSKMRDCVCGVALAVLFWSSSCCVVKDVGWSSWLMRTDHCALWAGLHETGRWHDCDGIRSAGQATCSSDFTLVIVCVYHRNMSRQQSILTFYIAAFINISAGRVWLWLLVFQPPKSESSGQTYEAIKR